MNPYIVSAASRFVLRYSEVHANSNWTCIARQAILIASSLANNEMNSPLNNHKGFIQQQIRMISATSSREKQSKTF